MVSACGCHDHRRDTDMKNLNGDRLALLERGLACSSACHNELSAIECCETTGVGDPRQRPQTPPRALWS
jgi:hypothetical protein